MDIRTTAHVVTHTHWDREWYLSFQQFRMRLVNLIDELIRILENEKDFMHFHMDGQTICLEDYAEVCPEKKETLKRLVKEGKIAVGPWYVLPDEFLAGGEALIRNLMIGHAIAAEYGGKMKVGYLPDTFGHCSQMPQIFSKFGLEGALIWRGLSGMPEELDSEFIWESPDGTGLFTIHLSDEHGYLNLFEIPSEPEAAVEEIRKAAAERLEFAVSKHVLLMNGFDHKPPKGETGRVIRQVSKKLEQENMEVRHSSLETYLREVKSGCRELRRIRKEFTLTNLSPRGKVNCVLRNVLSSRAYLKQRNYYCERLLEKYAEPQQVQLFMEGGQYRSGLFRTAWKYLIQNHPHDSICGCSIDAVHKDMERRFDWVDDIGSQCHQEGMYGIAKLVDTSALDKGGIPVHLFNTLCYDRLEYAVEIMLNMEEQAAFRSLSIKDGSGKELDCQILGVKRVNKVFDRWDAYPQTKSVKEVRLLVHAGKIPSFGYKTISVKPERTPALAGGEFISKRANFMENEYLRVAINTNGTVDVYDKAADKQYSGLHYFMDGGDIGDEYVYSPPFADTVVNTLGMSPVISLVQNGPLMAAYRVAYSMELPSGCNKEGYGREEEATVHNIIKSDIILRKGSKVVEFGTFIENNARDHRIRVLFPTGIHAGTVFADSNFDVVERSLDSVQPGKDCWIESGTGAQPQKRFIDISDENGGIAVFNRGIPEYEIGVEEGCTAALTLLRCTGYIGSPRSLTVANPPGPVLETPDAQCIGRFRFEYALYFHQGNREAGRVGFEAERYHVPVAGMENTVHGGRLPLEKSYFNLDNGNICVSAIKKAENRNSMIIRLYNPGSVREQAVLAPRAGKMFAVDLKEDRLEEVPVHDGDSPVLYLDPGEIKTLEVEHEYI